MNTATSRDNPNDQPPGAETPPVLARVPWLKPAGGQSEVALPESLAHDEANDAACQAIDESYFRPHSVVAAPDLGVEAWHGVPTALPKKPTPQPAEREVRFDPPQPLQTPEAEATQPQIASETTSASAPPTSVPTAQWKSIYRAASRNASDKPTTTTLRFDAPDVATNEFSEPAEPAHVEPTTAQRVVEPSAWHTWVSTIDDAVRQYHRVIVLAALLTAAGLMMLVLETQHPPHEPAPESIAPAALNAEKQSGEEGPALMLDSQKLVSAMQQEPGPEETGPTEPLSGGLAEDSQAMAPQQTASTASGPGSANPKAAAKQVKRLEPHRELYTADASEPQTPGEHSPSSGFESPRFQSTGAPEIVLPGYSAGGQRANVPRTARLSGEISSVPQQATR